MDGDAAPSLDREAYLDRLGTDTTGRYDVTTLLGDPETFAALRADLLAGVPAGAEPTVVVGIDALGFALGAALAGDLDVGFVPVRKGGKLPYRDAELDRRTVTDYSGERKELEIRRTALESGDRALVVDDWIETGAQMRAATELVESCGATVAAVLAVGAGEHEATADLYADYPVYGLL